MRSGELRLLAEEQAALRRIATLVARGVPSEEVFAAVTGEVGRLLSVEYANLSRYEHGGTVIIVARSGRGSSRVPVGRRWTLGGKNIHTLVFNTGRPTRIDGYADASGPLGDAAREDGVGSGVGTPVIVEGRVWGVMATYSPVGQPLPPDTETRLSNFTELLAVAISNAEGRARIARLAKGQAALRRVATLVAREAPPEELFAVVTEEVGQLLPVDCAGMGRYGPDGAVTSVATWGTTAVRWPVGSRWVGKRRKLATVVFETGRPARIDNHATASGAARSSARETGFRSAAATPIIVEGRLWGVVLVGSSEEEPLPADTEPRLANFTDLVATAIANTESRACLARLAEEQAALRRVATLVARGALPAEVFAAVVEEAGRLLPVDFAGMGRYDPDGRGTIVAASSQLGDRFPVGGRWTLGGKNVSTIVAQTSRAARLDGYADASGPLGVALRERGFRSSVGTPIIVDRRLWGVMIASSKAEQPLPADTETRLASFTELVTTAIANAESRAELMASRARIVAAADETRRRIERDLHDGTQQRLVSLVLELRAAQAAVPPQLGELDRDLTHVAEGLASVFDELREIANGIHPAILSEGGLEPALQALCRRSAVPVELDLHAGRLLPERVQVAAYYVVSEALTNAAKHARASVVHVELDTHDEMMRLAIRDDGIGGADASQGSGLVGLSDRLEALGGALQVTSPARNGTMLLIEIPIDGQSQVSPEP